MNEIQSVILETLKKEVVPAMGCTEPVAVALASAKASELAGPGELIEINLSVSPNIYKNGLAVGIPYTDEVGLWIAAAIGGVNQGSERDLEVLSHVGEDKVAQAKDLVNHKQIKLSIADTDDKIYIEAICIKTTGLGHSIIKDRHNQFVYLAQNDDIQLDLRHQKSAVQTGTPDNLLYTLSLEQIVSGVEALSLEDLSFMLEGIQMNLKIAEKGLEEKLGMGVGYSLNDSRKKGYLADDLHNIAMILTAAASDARMSGTTLPVMSSNGSGNNGLTAILPLAAYKEKFEVSDEKMAKAVAISHLVNSYIKNAIGRLSAICGCGVAAGTGAGVGLAWLLGATPDQMQGVVQNMIANTSGMICDGAKVGCALKLATSASAAVQSALLAVSGSVVPAHNGIIGVTAEETIKNLGILSNQGMKITDGVILDIMKNAL